MNLLADCMDMAPKKIVSKQRAVRSVYGHEVAGNVRGLEPRGASGLELPERPNDDEPRQEMLKSLSEMFKDHVTPDVIDLILQECGYDEDTAVAQLCQLTESDSSKSNNLTLGNIAKYFLVSAEDDVIRSGDDTVSTTSKQSNTELTLSLSYTSEGVVTDNLSPRVNDSDSSEHDDDCDSGDNTRSHVELSSDSNVNQNSTKSADNYLCNDSVNITSANALPVKQVETVNSGQTRMPFFNISAPAFVPSARCPSAMFSGPRHDMGFPGHQNYRMPRLQSFHAQQMSHRAYAGTRTPQVSNPASPLWMRYPGQSTTRTVLNKTTDFNQNLNKEIYQHSAHMLSSLDNASQSLPYRLHSPAVTPSGLWSQWSKTTQEKLNKILKLIHNQQKVCIILRGLPGSGKTTIGRYIIEEANNSGSRAVESSLVSADDYFVMNSGYDPALISEAHAWCKQQVASSMLRGATPVIVDNTNTQRWEMLPYVELAVTNNYEVHLLEPGTPWARKVTQLEKLNKHGVNALKLKQMLERFEPDISVSSLITNVKNRLEQNSQGNSLQSGQMNSLKQNAQNSYVQLVDNHVRRVNENQTKASPRNKNQMNSNHSPNRASKNLHTESNQSKLSQASLISSGNGFLVSTSVQDINTNSEKEEEAPKDLEEVQMALPQRQNRRKEKCNEEQKSAEGLQDEGWSSWESGKGSSNLSHSYTTRVEDNWTQQTHFFEQRRNSNDEEWLKGLKGVGEFRNNTSNSGEDGNRFANSHGSRSPVMFSHFTKEKSSEQCSSEDTVENSDSAFASGSSSNIDVVKSSDILDISKLDTVDSVSENKNLNPADNPADNPAIQVSKWEFPQYRSSNVVENISLEEVISESDKSVSTVSTWTSPLDLKIIYDMGLGKSIDDNYSDVFMLIRAACPRVINLSEEMNDPVVTRIPERVGLHKSCSVPDDLILEVSRLDENELKIELEQRAEILMECFPTVQKDEILELLSSTQYDVDAVAGLFIEFGYEYNEPRSYAASKQIDSVKEQSVIDVQVDDHVDRTQSQTSEAVSGSLGARSKVYSKLNHRHLSLISGGHSLKPKSVTVDREAILKKRRGGRGRHRGRGGGGGGRMAGEGYDDRVSINLPQEFCEKLINLFGPIQSSDGCDLTNDLRRDVIMDIGTARLIYDHWAATQTNMQAVMQTDSQTDGQTKENTDGRLNYGELENPAEDQEVSDIISITERIKIDAGNSLKTRSAGSSPILSRSERGRSHDSKVVTFTTPPPTVEPAGSLSTKLKRQQLYELYPFINQTILDEMYSANGYSLQETRRMVEGDYDLMVPPRDVLSSEAVAAMEAELLERGVANSLLDQYPSLPDDDDVTHQADITEMTEEELQAAIITETRKHAEWVSLAHLASSRVGRGVKGVGQAAVMSHYAGRARGSKGRLEQLQRRAAVLMSESREVEDSLSVTLDLHGFTVTDAVHVLSETLDKRSRESRENPTLRKNLIYVITGRGMHSSGGVAKVRPAVIGYLMRHGYRFSESIPGKLKILLT